MTNTLLLVDDEENILSALTRLLRRDGYTLFRATSGEEGLRLLAENDVGVIVSDQRMPQMTGVEFLTRARALRPDTVRIALSGYTDLDSVTDAINRGSIYKFLTKPWDDDLLRQNIAEAFERYHMRQENQRLIQELTIAKEKLTAINEHLEQEVAQRTAEAIGNLRTLQMEQAVLHSLPVAILGLDTQGIVMLANQMAEDLFRVSGQATLLGTDARALAKFVDLPQLDDPDKPVHTGKCLIAHGLLARYWLTRFMRSGQLAGYLLTVAPAAEGAGALC